MTTIRTSQPAFIVFLDLTHFAAESSRVGDLATANVIDGYYELVSHSVSAAGGRTVKFIGDAALAVFPEGRTDTAAAALLDVVSNVEEYMSIHGCQCRLRVRAHFGDVVAGEFGGVEDKRFDIIGQAVNDAARMQSNGVTLSEAALAKLSPSARARFSDVG